jgi:hypothetical protein
MRWRKLGLVYGPDGSRQWARSHALAPTPVAMEDGLVRIYFASCDESMVGRIGYVDVDADAPQRVINLAERPVLDIGDPGCFDDNGVNATSIVRVGGELRMYYFGYQLGTRVRYLLFGGLAVSQDRGESFARVSQVPITDRLDGERFVRSAPFVIEEPAGVFRMWYVGGNDFVVANGKEVPRYGVRYLESEDGVAWRGSGRPVLSPQGEDEYGFGRPYVRRCGDGYEMWYSLRSRSQGYRIGYAVSPDGLAWTRRDEEAGIDISASGWDSGMVCYASIVTVKGRTLMFYNGDGYGRAGFGVAVADRD